MPRPARPPSEGDYTLNRSRVLEYMCYIYDRMEQSMFSLRASEIGTYLFCARAWWYRRQGIEPQNQAELIGGQHLHRQHGRQVLLAGLWRVLAWVLLLAALALLTAYCTWRVV